MSSLRAKRRRSCGDKQRLTRDGAERLRRILYEKSDKTAGYRRTASNIDIYKCRFCGTWHVGHRKHPRKYARPRP